MVLGKRFQRFKTRLRQERAAGRIERDTERAAQFKERARLATEVGKKKARIEADREIARFKNRKTFGERVSQVADNLATASDRVTRPVSRPRRRTMAVKRMAAPRRRKRRMMVRRSPVRRRRRRTTRRSSNGNGFGIDVGSAFGDNII